MTPTRDLVLAATGGFFAFLAARAGLANFREFRRERHRAPLEPSEVYAASPPPPTWPRGWPAPDDVDDPRLAAAYRDLARDRQDSMLLTAEITMLTAGAGLGATIADVLTSTPAMFGAAVAVVFGAGGFLVKQYVATRWGRRASRYERRRVELRRAADPPAPRQPEARRRRSRPASR